MAIHILQKLKRKHNSKLYKLIRRRMNYILSDIFRRIFVQEKKIQRLKINGDIILNSDTKGIIRKRNKEEEI